ncbi:F-box/WD repeat-containing protein 4-like isoform X1 [Ptychodera flava]|uniref:F-box/WD repeat-containing protein 4-like isoform X1 n=2 Tax=Ptychodera flava TaxID=63121 RepID=UPI00396A4454
MKLLLMDLHDDILYEIISYLDVASIGRLSCACRKIYRLCQEDVVWRRIARRLVNIGKDDTSSRIRCLPIKERCRISLNWINGRCRDKCLMKFGINLLPWLQLEDQHLFLTFGADICCYKLRPNGEIPRSPRALCVGHQDDVCRFVKKGPNLVSGGRDGAVISWHVRTGRIRHIYHGHTGDVNCVDLKQDLILSGSRDQTVKLWSKDSGVCHYTVHAQDRVWAVKFNPWDSSFISGTASYFQITPLRLWDIQTGKLRQVIGRSYRKGAGILDAHFESPHCLLSCGYDTYIRIWDIRHNHNTSVLQFEEPDDSAIYCIQTDGKNLIASGSSRYGVVRLWDKRMTKCMQTFYVGSHISSPVYSLKFNSTQMYVALANCLRRLDFRSR